ncbi:MAG: hypothetical protein JNJ83_16690 [Verrucomicrobiaceae bacterium]|nr:hypothetical protein [Verrucomicrobiaceae bacterium]
MKVKPIYLHLAALLSAASLFAAGLTPNVRITPPGNHAGEFIGEPRHSVASANGLIAVGSPLATRTIAGTTLQTGGVHVFDAKSHKLLRTIYPADGITGGRFGEAVAVSGNMLVVGSPEWGTASVSKRGAVYLYNIDTGALVRKIEPSETPSADDNWGKSVAIEGDTVVFGAPGFDDTLAASNMGAVETYSIRADSALVTLVGVSVFSGLDLRQFGTSVAIWKGMVAAGAPGSNSGDGRVLLFDAVGGSTIVLLSDPKGMGAAGQYGFCVSMDDAFLVVGAPFTASTGMTPGPNAGSAYLYDVTIPTSPQARLGGIDGAPNQNVGAAVATCNGITAVGILGADYTPPGPGLGQPVMDHGAVVVLDHRARTLDQLTAMASGVGGRYGSSVGVTPDGFVLGGAPGDDVAGPDSGAVWKAGPYAHDASGMFQVLASTKTTALASGTASFSGFGELTAFNGVSYIASMTGPGTAGGKNHGLWSTLQSGFGPIPVAVANTPVNMGMPPFSSTETGKKVFRPLSNSPLDLFMRMTDASGVTSQYYSDGGVATGVVKVIDNSSATYPSLQNVAVKSIGESRAPFETGLFLGMPLKLRAGTGATPVTPASDSAIFTLGVAYVREGIDNVPMPGLGKHGEFSGRISFADSAQCIYSGFIQSTPVTSGIFVSNAATLVLSGSFAPDATGAATTSSPQYSSFLGHTGLDGTMARTYLFRATLVLDATKGVTPANNEALYSNVESVGIKQFARKGDIIPGTSLRWKRFLEYGIDNRGNILVLATVSGAGVTPANDTVLVVHVLRAPLPDATIVLLREGDIMPDGQGGRIATLGAVDMAFTSAASSYGVLVTLKPEKRGATAADNLAWMVGDISNSNSNSPSDYLPRALMRKGMRFSLLPGREKIASISVPSFFRDSSGAGNTGLQHCVGGSTTQPVSTAVVTFPDTVKAIVRR